MKISLSILIICLLFLDTLIYEVKGQTNELRGKKDKALEDTVFFEVDPKWKDFLFEFEEMPEFPGGEKAMIKYISENTIYPKSAIKDSISGLVILGFTVDTGGSTEIFKIFRGVQNDIDNECIRVVKEMPKWKPGSTVFRTEKGLYRKNIPVSYLIAFNFMLNDSEAKKGIIIKPK